MAHYSTERITFKGRLIEVGFRYSDYNGAVVIEGEPLELPDGPYGDNYLSQSDEMKELLFELKKALRQQGIIDEHYLYDDGITEDSFR